MKSFLVMAAFIIISILGGCYYDKQAFLDTTSACDTTIVTYSVAVNPVITASCAGCHSGANAPLGIKLDVFADLSTVALNGRLLGALTHSPGFSPMPKNGAKLSDCNIDKISKWISLGAPDN
ncbi:MAG: hypothetical protein ABI416_19075 [Ginsengibacter sp.]